MNYSSLVSNTILALKYFKKIPAEYLKLLSWEERNLFIKEWVKLCEQMESGLTEGSIFNINNLICKFPQLKNQFLGNLSIDEIRKAALNSNGTEAENKENLGKLMQICDDAFAIRDDLLK